MGKVGRAFCIFTPYILTIASLICLILVGLGSTNNGTSSLRDDLYFFRIDIHNLTNPTIIQDSLNEATDGELSLIVDDGDIRSAIADVEKYFNLQDFYNIGLWGYCGGNVTTDNKYVVTNCSHPKSSFWFNPNEVWNLAEIGLDNAIPSDVQDGLNIYKNVSKWMFAAYVVAFSVTLAELLVGITAIFSRWGSCVTTLISFTAFFFTAAASATSTALSVVLPRILNEKLGDADIGASMGENIFGATWLAAVFSLAACLFWAFSSCCCSGRSPYHHDRKAVDTEKGYDSPASQHPGSYEPYRK